MNIDFFFSIVVLESVFFKSTLYLGIVDIVKIFWRWSGYT